MRALMCAAALFTTLTTLACAPMVKRSTTSSTTIGTVVLKEEWAPERGVRGLEVKRDTGGVVLKLDAAPVCRVWSAEQQVLPGEQAAAVDVHHVRALVPPGRRGEIVLQVLVGERSEGMGELVGEGDAEGGRDSMARYRANDPGKN